MKQLQLNRVPYYLLLLLAFFPLMPQGIISIVSISFYAVSIFVYRRDLMPNLNKSNVKVLLVNIGFFLLLIISAFLSSNSSVASREVTRDLHLLLFPIVMILFFPKMNSQKIDKVMMSFTIANAILLFCIIFVTIKYYFINRAVRGFSEIPFRNIVDGGYLYINLHPTYVSIWFAMSILYLISIFKKLKNYTVPLISLFYVAIIIISSRVVFIALHVVFLFIIIKKVRKINKKTLAISIVSILLFGYLLSNISIVKYRFYKELSRKIELPAEKPSSIEVRYGIYLCNYNLAKDSFLFGYGVGDVQDKLNECYKSSYNTNIYDKKMDSHNYYIHMLLSGGVVVLLAFLVMCFFNFKLAIDNNLLLYSAFLLLMFITFLTENILARVHGNLFFALFNSIFLNFIISKNNNKINKNTNIV